MDPIETWHDAPTFEVMESKIKTLEAVIAKQSAALLDIAEDDCGCCNAAGWATEALTK